MITGAKQHITSVLLGVVAGLLVVNAYGLFFKPETQAVPTAQDQAALTPKQRIEQAQTRLELAKRNNPSLKNNEKVLALEQELKRLAERAQERRAAREAEKDSRPEESQHKEKERIIAAWTNLLREHDTEPVDATWSKKMAGSYQQDFAAIASEKGFAVGATDCRSKTCTVEVEWPSYGEALDQYADVVSSQFQKNCSVNVILPEPPVEQKDKPYKARYLFGECAPEQTVAALEQPAR